MRTLKRDRQFVTTCILALSCSAWCFRSSAEEVYRAQGEMTGEVTADSAIVQTRLTSVSRNIEGDVPGAVGAARFEYGTDRQFQSSQMTPWNTSSSETVYIAVEKIDTGYLSRDRAAGNDENAAATLMLSWGSVLRSHQLRACLAATEILAGHARTDETHIGATGVSLGGWLAVQTAMLNDRIAAVADFGRKTRSVPAELQADQYDGQRDLCHIIPGMLRLSDRNLMPVVLAPLPMLAGHGRNDAGSHQEHAANFRSICEAQYAELGASASYTYLVHPGGDTMPSEDAIAWFRKQFSQSS